MSEAAFLAALQDGPLTYAELEKKLKCQAYTINRIALRLKGQVERKKLYDGKVSRPRVIFQLTEA